jgi:D-alanyl-D-alanine carboxypeptidase/D-alanyl-D-alanine-endopeptidase (penicillin-binding protein 4)
VLHHDLSAIFEAPEFEHSIWSVLVRPVASDTPLYSLNASTLVMPGSNMKLLTLAAAVDRLGWDYRFQTKVVALAPVESGVLRGDLFIIGSGLALLSLLGWAASRRNPAKQIEEAI